MKICSEEKGFNIISRWFGMPLDPRKFYGGIKQ